jgi:hypothetical protein
MYAPLAFKVFHAAGLIMLSSLYVYIILSSKYILNEWMTTTMEIALRY